MTNGPVPIGWVNSKAWPFATAVSTTDESAVAEAVMEKVAVFCPARTVTVAGSVTPVARPRASGSPAVSVTTVSLAVFSSSTTDATAVSPLQNGMVSTPMADGAGGGGAGGGGGGGGGGGSGFATTCAFASQPTRPGPTEA